LSYIRGLFVIVRFYWTCSKTSHSLFCSLDSTKWVFLKLQPFFEKNKKIFKEVRNMKESVIKVKAT
ncbi:hypothetical protein, partial [Anaerotignum lactatifermentans]